MTEKALPIKYGHLDPKTEIRILILEAGSGTDPITCTLRAVVRGEEDYQALSYEWGDESKDDPIITVREGRKRLIQTKKRRIQIRRNLHEALKNIRKPAEDVKLWVDALCINQADIDEKNHQVAMMGKTYANAAGVIAWLGPAKDGSDLAMDWMMDKTKLRENLQRCGKASPEWDSVLALCHRPYWRRVWIIQELYLSRSYVVRCGTKAIDSNPFELSLGILNTLDFYKWFNGNPADQHVQARTLRGTPQFNNLRRWINVCIVGKFQCTRKVDMIYALLGISHDYTSGKRSIEVDYAKTPREVYLEVVSQNPAGWSKSDGWRLMKLAKMMDLRVDEDLRALVLEITNKKVTLADDSEDSEGA